jgi:hypothetical protein
MPTMRSARKEQGPTVWYFYKVRWGFQDEFLELFRRNHYPVLEEHLRTGRVTEIRTYAPKYHGDGRADWTFAVALTFKDREALTAPSGEKAIAARLFPDQERFLAEERRRFELLDAHWDVPLVEMEMSADNGATRAVERRLKRNRSGRSS